MKQVQCDKCKKMHEKGDTKFIIIHEYGYVLCYPCNEDYRIYRERFFKG